MSKPVNAQKGKQGFQRTGVTPAPRPSDAPPSTPPTPDHSAPTSDMYAGWQQRKSRDWTPDDPCKPGSRIPATYDNHTHIPVGTLIAIETAGGHEIRTWWVKTTDNTWASVHPSAYDDPDVPARWAVYHQVNNVSPCPTGWPNSHWIVKSALDIPDREPSRPEPRTYPDLDEPERECASCTNPTADPYTKYCTDCAAW